MAETILWPALNRWLPKYPDIEVEITVDNGFVDIVAERFDAGIRLGENLDKDMIAVPIGPMERCVIVGPPSYLAKHPVPTHPDQLVNHLCINRRFPSLNGKSAWHFEKDGQPTQVRVSGQVAFNRPEMILEAAVAGFGWRAFWTLKSSTKSKRDAWSGCSTIGALLSLATSFITRAAGRTPQRSSSLLKRCGTQRPNEIESSRTVTTITMKW